MLEMAIGGRADPTMLWRRTPQWNLQIWQSTDAIAASWAASSGRKYRKLRRSSRALGLDHKEDRCRTTCRRRIAGVADLRLFDRLQTGSRALWRMRLVGHGAPAAPTPHRGLADRELGRQLSDRPLTALGGASRLRRRRGMACMLSSITRGLAVNDEMRQWRPRSPEKRTCILETCVARAMPLRVRSSLLGPSTPKLALPRRTCRGP
ncbi:hypothetical protein ACVWWI_006571 [Bradyrhizobium sp. USDA 3686]|nr:hypothetical protein [Bradyrhizobium canariense]